MASTIPTKVSLSNIKSKLLRPALTSHYICKFSPTAVGGSKLINFLKEREGQGFIGADYQNPLNQEIIELSCSEASLPGTNYMTNEINDDFHGITERYAYRRSYDDRMDFTFYVDRDYRHISFFESWIAFIAGEKNKPATADRNYFYRVEFPDNYTTDELYITKFERDIGTPDEGPTLTYRFINAYPININTMPVSYESSQLLKCTVSFTFSRYLIEKTAGGTGTSRIPLGPTTAPGVPPITTAEGDQLNAPLPPTTTDGRPLPQFPGNTTLAALSSIDPLTTAPGVPSTLRGQPTGSGSATLVGGTQSTRGTQGASRTTAGSQELPRVSTQTASEPTINKNAGNGAVIRNANSNTLIA